MKIFNVRLKIAVATIVLLAGCATTDDYYSRPPSVSGSVSVGYYDGYYNDPWYGNNCCYGGYPPVIIGPPPRPIPPIENRPNRPTTLPAQVNRPASRPAPMPRPTARPRR